MTTRRLRPDTAERAARLIARLVRAGFKIACAESCTGGLIAAALTETPGSSAAFDVGYVVYSNVAKADLLGVPSHLFASRGAVSREVAAAMAEGALARSGAELALAATGVAGPAGGSREKPVGLVYLALARRGAATQIVRRIFPGDRAAVRAAAVDAALDLAASSLGP